MRKEFMRKFEHMRSGSKMRRWRAISFALLLCCVGMLGCVEPSRPSSSTEPNISAPLGDEGLAQFDTLITPAFVFLDNHERSLYDVLPATTTGRQRGYGFSLKRQPGMDESRHFHIITVTLTRNETSATSSEQPEKLASIGGPNGSFIDAHAQTADHTYDVRVTLGSLLPTSVNVQNVDIADIANRVARLYDTRHSPTARLG
jgi:hypothetical protein